MNVDFVQSMARAILQLAAGYLVGKGAIDASGAELAIGSAVSLVGVIWSWFTHTTTPPAP